MAGACHPAYPPVVAAGNNATVSEAVIYVFIAVYLHQLYADIYSYTLYHYTSCFYLQVIHYIASTAALSSGELVLVDAGCEYHGYTSDITRTWPGVSEPDQ